MQPYFNTFKFKGEIESAKYRAEYLVFLRLSFLPLVCFHSINFGIGGLYHIIWSRRLSLFILFVFLFIVGAIERFIAVNCRPLCLHDSILKTPLLHCFLQLQQLIWSGALRSAPKSHVPENELEPVSDEL